MLPIETQEIIKDSITTICAKLKELYLRFPNCEQSDIERVIRDVRNETYYISSKVYQSRSERKLIGAGMTEVGK